MTDCALPCFMFTCVPSGNVKLIPDIGSAASAKPSAPSAITGRNIEPVVSEDGSSRSYLALFWDSRICLFASPTLSPRACIHLVMPRWYTWISLRKEVRRTFESWLSRTRYFFHAHSYRSSAVILLKILIWRQRYNDKRTCTRLHRGYAYQRFYDKKTLGKIHDFFLDSKKLTDNEIERLYLNDQLFKQQKEYSILVVGNMSAGKSTLINAIVGSKVERVKSTVCTSQLKYIYNKPYEDGITMTDGFSYAWTDKVDISVLDAMHIALHFKPGTRNRRCVLIDTPGVNYANESTHLNITANALNSKNYDIILYVMNALYFESNDEKRFLSTIAGIKGKRIVIALNQLDQLNMDDDSIEQVVNEVKIYVRSMVNGNNISVVPISAKAAYLASAPQEQLSKQESFTKEQYTKMFGSMFYDLGLYGTGTRSKKNDLCALSGLTNLLNNIEL